MQGPTLSIPRDHVVMWLFGGWAKDADEDESSDEDVLALLGLDDDQGFLDVGVTGGADPTSWDGPKTN